MKNAHVRMGSLELTKRSESSTTHVKVHLDRFIGEHPKSKAEIGEGHLLSVFGNDQDISAIWSALLMEEQFTVQGRLVSPLTITFGKDPQAFRGSISISGRKRPVRHLVAISGELAQTHLSDDREYGRSIVSDSDPVFILYRLATRFGLPVLPEWGSWFVSELKHKHKIQPLLGIGCSPVVVYGTKQTFMHWISLALKKKRIFVPAENTSVSWEIPDHFIPF